MAEAEYRADSMYGVTEAASQQQTILYGILPEMIRNTPSSRSLKAEGKTIAHVSLPVDSGIP